VCIFSDVESRNNDRVVENWTVPATRIVEIFIIAVMIELQQGSRVEETHGSGLWLGMVSQQESSFPKLVLVV
jgi:hypothetical protein